MNNNEIQIYQYFTNLYFKMLISQIRENAKKKRKEIEDEKTQN